MKSLLVIFLISGLVRTQAKKKKYTANGPKICWNTFKKLVKDDTEDEKDHMFRGAATRVYHLAS